jgi:alkylation response protein AidB-like acyl-CoA dehydrogenase
MGIEISSLIGSEQNKKVAKNLTKFNNFLDSNFAKTLKLRKAAENVVYFSAYAGVKVAEKSSKVFSSSASGKQDPARLDSRKASDLFDLNYTEEQTMVKEAVQQFALKVRETAEKQDEKFSVSETIEKEFNELGLVYYQVPESMGGMMKEKSTVTQMMMLETLAHGDLGQALALFTPHSVLNAIVQWGSEAQQKELIPPFLTPTPPKASIALNEPTPLFSPYELSTTAEKSGNGYVLNGVKNMVPLAATAEYFLVVATTKDKGPQVFIVDRNSQGLTITADRAMGLNAAQLGQLKLSGVNVDASAVLGGGDGFNYDDYLNYCKLGWCSLAVGCCQAVLDYVIPYANDRIAFGEPISHRQAVAFLIADIKIELDSMRVLTQRAVAKAEQGLTFAKETYLAHIMCSDKSMFIGSTGVQLLGGHGYIRDFPVQRWYRDLRAVSIAVNGVHI